MLGGQLLGAHAERGCYIMVSTDAKDDPEVTTSSTQHLTRAEYFAERGLLLQARQSGYERAEQMIVGGATGALILSITFLERIAPAATATYPSLLVVAWVLLLGCLVASLSGNYASARAFDAEIDRLEASLHTEPIPANAWATCTRVLGIIGSTLLVAGISLMAWFAYLNAPFNQGGTP